MTSEERRQARYQRRKVSRNQKQNEYLSHYDDFSLVADPDNLYKAYKKSKCAVSWKESVQRYEMNCIRNILETVKELNAGVNMSRGFVEFDLNERGKTRHIKSVHISERIVQKCLCDHVLVPMLSRSLIYDNGASLKNKGLHFAIRRIITHMSKYYRQNKTNEGYCLSVDFSKYFDNIQHDFLFTMLQKTIKDARTMKLVHDFIEPFGAGKSLGLGSQVSQICAIYYANQLDHFIKERLHICFYGRYMDDLYLIHQDKKYLYECLKKIKVVCAGLGITVNMKKTRIKRLKDGIHFLKGIYFLNAKGRIIRRATSQSRKTMRRKLNKFYMLVKAGRMALSDVYTAYQSWRGNYRRRFDAFHTIRRMDALYNALFINNHLEAKYG